jgi:hypothetical protein
MCKLGVLKDSVEPDAEAVQQYTALCKGGCPTAMLQRSTSSDFAPTEEVDVEGFQEWA